MPKPVVIVGALDTKGADFAYLRRAVEAHGLETLLIDFGVMEDPALPVDTSAAHVAEAGGASLEKLRADGDKSVAMRAMRDGLVKVITDLYAQGQLGGIIGMGGGGGTSIATAAMRALPVGVPKLMVSTVAAGDVSQYIETKDILMLPSVVDVSGLNSISRVIYHNAAAAIAGMTAAEPPETQADKPIITASMFGNTTQAVNHAKAIMEQAGYEVLVFHATGTGGRTMESLIADGFVTANFDLTTTELADYVCGGVLSAGPGRLKAAAARGIPTVLVPGCVDMANFWGIETVPEKYRQRNLYEWNPNITLLRTNSEENEQMGRMIADAANASAGPVKVLLPLKGVSQLDSPGGPFWDEAADHACFQAIKSNLKPGIEVIEVDANINDPAFSQKAARTLLAVLG